MEEAPSPNEARPWLYCKYISWYLGVDRVDSPGWYVDRERRAFHLYGIYLRKVIHAVAASRGVPAGDVDDVSQECFSNPSRFPRDIRLVEPSRDKAWWVRRAELEAFAHHRGARKLSGPKGRGWPSDEFPDDTDHYGRIEARMVVEGLVARLEGKELALVERLLDLYRDCPTIPNSAVFRELAEEASESENSVESRFRRLIKRLGDRG